MSGEIPMKQWLAGFENGSHPIDQFLVKSLREIYTSGQYRIADISRTKGSADERNVTELLRLVVNRDGSLESVVVTTTNDPEVRENATTIMRAVGVELPFDATRFEPLARLALEAFSQTQLTTVAAMSWGHSLESGHRTVRIYYPCALMTFIPVPKSHQSNLAVGVAGYFIQKTAIRSK